MPEWLNKAKRSLKRRRKRPAALRTTALGAGQVAGSEAHLRALLAAAPFKTPGEGQVLIAESGQVGLALEGAMAIPAAGLVVRGWLTDPHHQIVALWLDVDGALRPAHLATRMFRHDVLEQRGLLEAFPGYRAGFYLFEPWDLPGGGEVRASMHAVVRIGEAYAVLSSGTTLMAGKGCSLDRLSREFEAGLAPPDTVARTAEPLLDGLAAANRRIAWRECRVDTTSGKPADLAVVVVVNDNLEMLHHILAALETCTGADVMEVIIALQAPGIERQVVESIREWRGASPFAAIKALVPVVPVGFAMAANVGVAFASAPTFAIASDEILPPGGHWTAAALERLAVEPNTVLIPTITTFDRRPFTCASAFELPWEDYEHDHSALRQVADSAMVQDCLTWGCGFVVTTRAAFDASGGFKESLTGRDACLLEWFCRLRSTATVKIESFPYAFTHLRLPAYGADNAAARLWAVYAMVASLQRLAAQDTAEAASQPAAAEAEAPVAKPESAASLSPA